MEAIKAKSPTRVDFAGGTLDMWPLYNFVGGATTINLAIDIFTYAELYPAKDNRDKKILIESRDLNLAKEFPDLESLLKDSSPDLALYQSHFRYWKPDRGFHLITKSESPVGAGLGGSSSLTISLLKVMAQFCGRRFKDIHSMVNAAHNLEAELLQTPTGTQDYYPAVSAGLNFIQYDANGIRHEQGRFDIDKVKDFFMLAYTGKAHHSGLNNFEVLKSAVAKEAQTMRALQEIKDISDEMLKVLKRNELDKLPGLFKRELESRVNLCPAFNSPEIQELTKLSLGAGAMAVKICGAGGGGCVLIWVSPEKRAAVAEACQRGGFQILEASPVGRE